MEMSDNPTMSPIVPTISIVIRSIGSPRRRRSRTPKSDGANAEKRLSVPTDKGDLSEGSVRVIEQMLYWELTSNNTDPSIVLIRAISKGRATHDKTCYTPIKGHYFNPK